MLNNFALFIAIAQAGSLQKAAAHENMPASTLTRRLQKLEDELGCKLLHRSPRGIKLTPEGEAYFDKCQSLIASLEQNIKDIQQDNKQLSGTVRMLAPTNLSLLLTDFWADFLTYYPDINLSLSLDNRTDNFLEQGADLALRVGKQQDSNLIQKRLASVSMCIVASEKYLHNHLPIQRPNDLLYHQWLIAQPLSVIDLMHKQSGEKAQVHLQNNPDKMRLQVNEISLCMALAKQGLGLTYIPENQCQRELQNGELIQVLPNWQLPSRDVYAVWNTQQYLPMRVRVLIDALASFMNMKLL